MPFPVRGCGEAVERIIGVVDIVAVRVVEFRLSAQLIIVIGYFFGRGQADSCESFHFVKAVVCLSFWAVHDGAAAHDVIVIGGVFAGLTWGRIGCGGVRRGRVSCSCSSWC